MNLKALLFLLLSMAWGICPAADLTLHNAQVQVYFNPSGGCTEAIVSTLRGARQSMLVQAYEFTSTPIAEALKAEDGD